MLTGFISLDDAGLSDMLSAFGLAMSFEDLKFVQACFRDDEKRDPTLAELRVIDTYWSDHCRHTTFLTKLESVAFGEGARDRRARLRGIPESAQDGIYGDQKKDICLMDIATLYAKEAKKTGPDGGLRRIRGDQRMLRSAKRSRWTGRSATTS